jgi:uncharacterized membrane protein YecN with MAPEG domain
MITLLYGSILGVQLLLMTIRVVLLRRSHSVGLGAGQHHDLEKAIRAHANLIEYAPLALILIALLEQNAAPAWQLHSLGATLVIARLLHAWGLSRHSGVSFGRMIGMFGTVLVILSASVLGLLRWFSA